MDDCLIVGGGVIGLSLAYALSGEGRRTRVLDAGEPGRESSWAGAGILPPAAELSLDSREMLSALSNRMHAQWARTLREETGVDNGFRASGGVYLARSPIEADDLAAQVVLWRSGGVEVVAIRPEELARWEPALRPDPPALSACLLPQEAQLRNPRHIKALLAACRARGVAIESHRPAIDFLTAGARVEAVVTPCGRFAAETFCLAAGCWSGLVARRLGFAPGIKPVRGQIVLLAADVPPLDRVVNEGKRYLVPRDDGRVLVGSTEEDVGFDRRATPEVRDSLLAFAASLAPSLAAATVERQWAGLRPAADGNPYIGRIPEWDNAYISAGHFRHGLQWSTGSAAIVARLMLGQDPPFDLGPFAPSRGGRCSARADGAS